MTSDKGKDCIVHISIKSPTFSQLYRIEVYTRSSLSPFSIFRLWLEQLGSTQRKNKIIIFECRFEEEDSWKTDLNIPLPYMDNFFPSNVVLLLEWRISKDCILIDCFILSYLEGFQCLILFLRLFQLSTLTPYWLECYNKLRYELFEKKKNN